MITDKLIGLRIVCSGKVNIIVVLDSYLFVNKPTLFFPDLPFNRSAATLSIIHG